MPEPVVLLCLEGGSGVGHAMRIKRIAGSLSRFGARCIVAASRKSLLDGFLVEALQAPQDRRGKEVPPPLDRSLTARDLSNFTSLMWELCFWRRSAILSNIRGWDKIYAAAKPDAVVADLAPFALLAAAGRIPTAVVGNAYFVPACIDGYFTPDGLPASPPDKALQMSYFANIKWAYKQSKLGSPANIAAALCGDAQFPASLPSLDPRYSIRPQALVPPELDALPEISSGSGEDILVYAGDDPAAHRLAIEAALGVGRKTVLYASEAARSRMNNAWPTALEIRTEAFTPAEVASRAALVVHHGGAGMTHLSALAGVPQLIAYRGHERWTNATGVWRTGAGAGMALDAFDAKAFHTLGIQFSGVGPHRDKARQWATESQAWIAGRLGQDVIAESVLRLASKA